MNSFRLTSIGLFSLLSLSVASCSDDTQAPLDGTTTRYTAKPTKPTWSTDVL